MSSLGDRLNAARRDQPDHSSSQALRELATELTGEPVAPDAHGTSGPTSHAQDRKAGLFRRKK